jgi:hypothetical protein
VVRATDPYGRILGFLMLHNTYLCSRCFLESDFTTAERLRLDRVAVTCGSDSASQSHPAQISANSSQHLFSERKLFSPTLCKYTRNPVISVINSSSSEPTARYSLQKEVHLPSNSVLTVRKSKLYDHIRNTENVLCKLKKTYKVRRWNSCDVDSGPLVENLSLPDV